VWGPWLPRLVYDVGGRAGSFTTVIEERS